MMLIHKIETRLNEEKYVEKYVKMLQSTMDRIDNEMMQIFKRVNVDGNWSNRELAKYNRKMKLREQIRQELKQYNKDFLSTFRNDLADLYKDESLFTQKLLKNELNITKGFDKLPVQAVKSQVVDAIEIKGKTIADYISKYSTDLTFRVEQEVFQSIALGENPRKTTRRLNDIYGTMAKNRVNMTTRSWQLAIYNQSNLDTYDQAGLKKVRYLATLDVRTCPTCAVDHNKVMAIDNIIFLPRHVYCRCAYSPYIDSKLTEPADSYEGWLQDSSRTDEELELTLGNVQKYMKRGLISQKEGTHLEKIIENIILERMGIVNIGFTKENKKVFTQLLPDGNDKTLNGLASAHKEVLDFGHKTNNENLITVKRGTGEKTYTLTSDKHNAVEFTPEFLNHLKNQEKSSIILVHNHPGSSSFSAADLNVLNRFDSIDAITIEGHDGTRYICRIRNGEVKSAYDINKAYHKYKKKYSDYYIKRITSGELTEKEAWKNHSHKIIEEIAKEFNWEYIRILPD